MAFSSTALNAYVKRRYDPKFIDNSLIQMLDSTLKPIKKETDGSGENYTWMTDVDDVDGGSADFVIAQAAAANNSPTVGSKFLSDWNDYADVAQISASIIGKTRNNDGAWMKAVDVAMKKKMRAIAHANAVMFQSRGWGEISQITSPSGSTFVPLVRSDITKYVRGMPLHFSSALNSATLRSSTVLYVTAVSYTPGSELVTCSGTMASVGAVANDWAFRAGCRQDSATPARIALTGIAAWCPNQAVGNTDMADATITNIFGAPRTSNSRLYGTCIDATGGGSLLSALIDGAQEALTVGNATSLELFCSKANFASVAKDLNAAVVYDGNPATKSVGTKRLLIYSDGDKGEAHLQVSRTTNDSQVWGYDPSQVILRSIGGAPHIDAEDGLQMCRQSAAQGYETRWFQQAIYEFTNPAGLLRVQLT